MMLSTSIYSRLWVLICVTYLLTMDHSSRAEGLCNNGHHCNDGDVCLERGSGNWEGNVMVCSNGVWGAVCGDDWDMDDAKVTCRQLGYDTEKIHYYHRSYFGYQQPETPTVLNNVQCVGNEDNLIECTATLNFGTDVQYCDPGNMAGVFCGYGKACSNGEIRFTPYIFHPLSINDDISLYDGRGAGALEYCREGQWTYISSNDRYRWDVNEAKVACKQLGFMSNKVDIVYFRGHRYLSSISCSYMQCTGSENSLSECLKVSTECPDPYHSAKIRCYSYGSASKGCSQGDIRLYSAFNDTPATEGVLQICSGNNTWNSVCSNSYVHLCRYIAKIACIQLGYRGALAIRYDGGFYYGYSEYNDRFSYSCDDASYTNLQQCTKHKYYGLCNSNSAMGLVCYTSAYDGASRGCSQGDVRLYQHFFYDTADEGVLQICSKYNTWHSVCYDSYLSFPYIAKVACIQLGYRGAFAVGSYSIFIYVDDLYFESYGNDLFSYSCNDTSYTNLQQCKHIKSRNVNCRNMYDSMRLKCYTTDVNECTDGSVRLVRSTDTGLSNRVDEGRVEYCYDNMWAPVCDLTSTTATLMCQKMGFNFATYSVITDYYKRSSKKSSFDYIHCSTSAIQLSDCKVYFKKTISSWPLADTSCLQEYTLTCFTHEAPKELVDVSAPIIIPFTAPIAISVLIFLVIVRYCARAVRRNRQRDTKKNPDGVLVTIVSMPELGDIQKPENMC